MANVKRVSSTHASHSFSDEEKESFVEHINQTLGKKPELKGRLPINPSDNSLFAACSDGVILWYDAVDLVSCFVSVRLTDLSLAR